jgi:hypothetical protein
MARCPGGEISSSFPHTRRVSQPKLGISLITYPPSYGGGQIGSEIENLECVKCIA